MQDFPKFYFESQQSKPWAETFNYLGNSTFVDKDMFYFRSITSRSISNPRTTY